jgi:hypothetical protein
LKPRTAPPEIAVRYYPYVSIDSTIRLERGHRLVKVRISDALEQAPMIVIEALAYILLGKLYRKPVPAECERRYKSFVNQPQMREQALKLRRRRGHKRLRSPQGLHYDLNEVFEGLNEKFFGGKMSKPTLGWSQQRSRRLLGHYDAAHHAIVVSSLFDHPKAPRFLVEYIVYHEMLHIQYPAEHRDERRCVHTREFRWEERKFPQYREALEWIRRL